MYHVYLCTVIYLTVKIVYYIPVTNCMYDGRSSEQCKNIYTYKIIIIQKFMNDKLYLVSIGGMVILGQHLSGNWT